MPEANGSLFAGVFNFVSREFEQFVANATGSTLPEPEEPEEEDEEESLERSETPPPPRSPKDTVGRRSPLPRALKRRPSISMPGSLFPRSPSLDPESSSAATTEREQRVRFASPPDTPRHRKQFHPAVQAAVGRFQQDADPSILLPKVRTSPLQYSRADKGKGTSSEPTPVEEGIRRVRGKEKELVAVREDLDRNERRLESTNEAELEQIKQDRDRDKEKIRMLQGEIERLKQELMRRPPSFSEFHPPPPPPPPPPPLKTLPNASSNPTLFASARASLRHAPTPVENPINPPTRRAAAGMPTLGIPPDKMAAFLNEMKSVRLRKVSAKSASLGSDASFASAPNMSIGSGAGSSSSSFLRRSLSSVNRSTNEPPWCSRNVAAGANHSMSELEIRIGEKRKRTVTGSQEELRAPLRHRSALPSADSSFATTSSVPSTNTETLAGSSHSQSYIPVRQASSANNSWPSSATDAPTPSLSSDNDGERAETSPDDQPPSTPPVISTGPSRAFFRFRGNGIPVEPKRTQSRNSDVSMADAPDQEPKLKSNAKPTIFDKRPPTSPFPDKSPRRPRPPARKTQTNHQQQHTLPSHSTPWNAALFDEDGDEEDPLSFSLSSPVSSKLRRIQTRQDVDISNVSLPPATSAPSSSASSQSQSQSRPRHSPRHRSGSASRRSSRRRRLTLDEELRTAFAAESEIHNDDDDDDEEEDNVFVGVGTRSKRRGFLPGGGAAGVPVFRGVGYVDGAAGDEEALEEERRHSRRSVSRSNSRRHDDDDDDEEYLPPPSRRGVAR